MESAPQWLGGHPSEFGLSPSGVSDMEFEEDHIAVLDNIVFAFHPIAAAFAGDGKGTQPDEIVETDGFRFDESLFEVGMNYPGGFGGVVAGVDGPSPDLLVVMGEEGSQSQQPVGGMDQGVDARFRDSQFFEILARVLRAQINQIAIELSAEDDGIALMMGLGIVTHLLDPAVLIGGREIAVLDIGREQGGLVRQQKQVSGDGLVFDGQMQGMRRLAGV